MKLSLPRPLTLLAMIGGFALVACTPLDKDTGQPLDRSGHDADSGSEEKTPSPLDALRNDKQKVAWIIGSQLGGQLAPIKDEIDFRTLMQAAREHMEGNGQALGQDEQAEIMQAFDARMQAKMQAEQAALAEENLAQGQAFLEANAQKTGVTTTASGLQYQVLSEGTGRKPGPLDTVRVHYEGTLLNGEIFDSSYARNEPAQFSLDAVIPGWREGVLLMNVGSKYRLWIPSILAYGRSGGPGGPNATLVFEVELLEIVDPSSKPHGQPSV